MKYRRRPARVVISSPDKDVIVIQVLSLLSSYSPNNFKMIKVEDQK